MRNVLVVLTVLLFAALTLGQPCPSQQYPDWAGAPTNIDPNRIAIDPYSGKQLFLGWQYARVGTSWIISVHGCDPDGDPLSYVAVGGQLRTAGGQVSIIGAASAPGLTYVDISVTDQPPDPNEAITVTGTYVVIALPPNRPPVLGCGSSLTE